MSMSSADTPTTSYAQPNLRGSFYPSVPSRSMMPTTRPRSPHGGVLVQNLSVADLHQRLGSLQAQLSGTEDALDREKGRTHRIRAEREELRREVGRLNQTVQQQAWTIDDHKRKITEQAREIHDQSVKLEQQKKTIKVQSDTISGKQHTIDRGVYSTPTHKDTQRKGMDETPTAAPSTARRTHITEGPPPAFTLRRSELNPSHPRPSLRTEQSFNTQRKATDETPTTALSTARRTHITEGPPPLFTSIRSELNPNRPLPSFRPQQSANSQRKAMDETPTAAPSTARRTHITEGPPLFTSRRSEPNPNRPLPSFRPQQSSNTQRKGMDETPAAAPSTSSHTHITEVPPTPFTLRRSQPTSSYASSSLRPQQSSNTQRKGTDKAPIGTPAAPRHSHTTEVPPTPFTLHRSQPDPGYAPPILRPQHTSNTQALVPYGELAQPQTQQRLGSNLSELVLHDVALSPDSEYLNKLQLIFNLSDAWARNYSSIPNAGRDTKIPEMFMAKMKGLSSSTLAAPLFKDANTRHFLVAKTINHYLVTKVFKVNALKGFTSEADEKLGLNKAQVYPNTPLAARRAMNQALAKTVREVTSLPGFGQFLGATAVTTADKLLSELRPAMGEGLDDQKARRELVELITVGHELTVGMYTMPFEFSFEFPPAGTLFDPSCMVSHDPRVRGDPLGLQRRGAAVRLGVSPVSVKWEVKSVTNVPQTIHYAKVLLLA